MARRHHTPSVPFPRWMNGLCPCCFARAFAIFARTLVLAVATERSESQLVRAKLAEFAKRREEQHNANQRRTPLVCRNFRLLLTTE